MEPKDQGDSKPNLSADAQNPAAWWQPPTSESAQSVSAGQPAATPRELTGSNSLHPQPVLTSQLPVHANNSDLVETEWVDAAKRIMDTYKTDPYNKNRALTFLRADYMKKRYNKDLKVPEN